MQSKNFDLVVNASKLRQPCPVHLDQYNWVSNHVQDYQPIRAEVGENCLIKKTVVMQPCE
jgi:hypothetical protein